MGSASAQEKRVRVWWIHPSHSMIEDRAGQFAVNLEGSNRLVFKPDDDPVPVTDDGSIDYSRVTAV